jgi:hypothetical protein
MKLISGKTKGKSININEPSPEKLKSELLNETLQFLGMEHDTSIQVYPSIAAPIYRMLGYWFKEYGEYGLARFASLKVMAWRPYERRP